MAAAVGKDSSCRRRSLPEKRECQVEHTHPHRALGFRTISNRMGVSACAWSGWWCCHEVYVRFGAPRMTVRTTDTLAQKLPRVVVTATHNSLHKTPL